MQSVLLNIDCKFAGTLSKPRKFPYEDRRPCSPASGFTKLASGASSYIRFQLLAFLQQT